MSPLQVTTLSVAAAAAGFVGGQRASRRDADQLRRQLAAAHRDATHDQLTGLRNRLGLAEAWAQVGNRCPAVILLDLDGFKPVNDTYGHNAGDTVLATVGRRLARHDVAVRLGGDEFVVVAPAADGPLVAHQAAAAVRLPVRLDNGRRVTVTASVGWTISHGGDLSTALAQADAAMYRTKTTRQRQPARFHPGRDDRPAVGADPRPAVRVRDLPRTLPMPQEVAA